MKKAFTIKSTQSIVAKVTGKVLATKNESENVLYFLSKVECCGPMNFFDKTPVQKSLILG